MAATTLVELNGGGDDPKKKFRASKQDWTRDHGCTTLEERYVAVYWHLLPKPGGVPQYIVIDYDEPTEDELPPQWKDQLPYTYSQSSKGYHFFAKVNGMPPVLPSHERQGDDDEG